MIRTSLLAICLVIFGTVGMTETSTVRSGEHDTFTRLTLPIPPDSDWSIDREENSAKLTVKSPDLQFDTSLAFDRIPRTRLLALSATAPYGELSMRFGCDCELESTLRTDGLLVIDIKDRQSDTVDDDGITLPPLHRALGSSRSESRNADAHSPLEQRETGLESNAAIDPTVPGDPSEPEIRLKSPSVGLNISERRLLEQIGRAANQGLLSPVGIPPDEKKGIVVPPGSSTPYSGPPQILPLNVTAETSVDQGFAGVSDALKGGSRNTACISESFVGISEWGDGRSLVEQVADARGAVYGEFDRPDSAAIKQLAKTYLFFGFGAEASHALDLMSDNSLEITFLRTMASILDGETMPSSNPFEDQESCGGETALWSVLAGGSPSRARDGDEIQQAFARLPDHLRKLLGPDLSQSFAKVGKTEIAASILRSMDRVGDGEIPGKDFADAIVRKSSGDVSDAIRKLDRVVEKNSDYSPQALIELIDIHWLERKPTTPAITELAEAYETELKTSSVGPDMRRALVYSLSLNGRFEDALQTVERITRRDGSEAGLDAKLAVMDAMVDNAADPSFLKYALANRNDIAQHGSAVLRSKSARRLLALGFPQAALDTLATEAKPADEDVMLMRAQAAIALGQPHRAMVELLSVSSNEAQELRAKAMQTYGDYRLAGQTLMNTGNAAEASRWLWLADAPEMISVDEPSYYTQLAEATDQLVQSPDDTTDLPPLTNAQALLEESRSARETIDQLFDVLRTSGLEQ